MRHSALEARVSKSFLTCGQALPLTKSVLYDRYEPDQKFKALRSDTLYLSSVPMPLSAQYTMNRRSELRLIFQPNRHVVGAANRPAASINSAVCLWREGYKYYYTSMI